VRRPWLLSVLAVASAVHAETLYVVEQVVVNVNSAPDASGERVATIKSGEAVEVLERQGDQIHVHLPNGTEGWVRKSYLSADEPLQHRLSERTAEVDKLKQDVARLESELAAARTGAKGSKPSATSAPNASSSAASATGEAPAQTNSPESDPATGEPAYFMTPPEAPARPVWHWALGSFIVALVLGYGLGWYVLDRRIRRKFGGLRIY
jgi:hypothetical protein